LTERRGIGRKPLIRGRGRVLAPRQPSGQLTGEVRQLVARLENPTLVTDPPPYRPSPVLRGPRHLMVGVDRIAQ